MPTFQAVLATLCFALMKSNSEIEAIHIIYPGFDLTTFHISGVKYCRLLIPMIAELAGKHKTRNPFFNKKWKTNFWPFCGILPHTFKIFQETPCCTLLTPCVWHCPFKLNDVVADKGCVDITVSVDSVDMMSGLSVNSSHRRKGLWDVWPCCRWQVVQRSRMWCRWCVGYPILSMKKP